jgi:Ca2+-binding EF-hand superfamily protein
MELLSAEQAMLIMEPKMSERFRTVREAFIRIDSDGDGFIGPTELRAQLEMMGMKLSGREFRRLWRMFDTSGDDQINYVEFNNKVGVFIKPASQGLQFNRPQTPPMKDWQAKNVAAQIRKRVTDIAKTFKEIDTDESGVIDQTEFMIALRKLGLRGIGDSECFAIMERFRRSTNKTPGSMTYDEFEDCMREYLKVPESTLKSQNDEDREKNCSAAEIAIGKAIGGSGTANEIVKTLQRFDLDSINDLSIMQLRSALDEIGAELTEKQFSALVANYDPQNDGSIGVTDFAHKLSKSLENQKRKAVSGAVSAEACWARLGIRPALDPISGRRVDSKQLAKVIAPRLGMSESELVLLHALLGRANLARIAWERFDKENTGEITKAEFIKGIEASGAVIPVSDELLNILASRFDRRKSGRMSYSDLLATYRNLLDLNDANIMALGFEWLPGFGKSAAGPDVSVFKKGSNASAYVQMRDSGATSDLTGRKPDQVVSRKTDAYAEQQRPGQHSFQQQQQQQHLEQHDQHDHEFSHAAAVAAAPAPAMQRGRQVAGPVHGGGRSRSLAHAGRSAMKGAHSQPPQSHRYTDDEDSAPNMATTYRKMAIVLGKRGWPSAVSELKKRAEREVQRNTAMGTSANGASLWAGNGGNGKANEVIVGVDLLRDTLAKFGVPLTGRECSALYDRFAGPNGTVDLIRLGKEAGLA